jgi:hypothetical protein
MGLTKRDSLRANNIFEFGLDEVGDHIYSGKVNVDEITNINNYDVHLKVVYDDDYEIFRFKERLFKKENSEIVELNKNKDLRFYFTSLGNFSITKGYCRNFFDYRADSQSMTLIPHTDGAAIYKVAFNYKYDNVYFSKKDESPKIRLQNELELIWKYSIEENTKYNLNIEIHKNKFKLKKDAFVDFKEQTVEYNGKKIRIFEDDDGSIAIILK